MIKPLAKLTLLSLILLTGCGIKDTVTAVKDEVNQTVQTETTAALEGLGITELIYLTPNQESQTVKSTFTGQVYVLVTRKELEKHADKQSFRLNDQVMETIPETSEEHFNLRYNGQTYFTIGKVEVDELNELQLNSDWNQSVLLALKN